MGAKMPRYEISHNKKELLMLLQKENSNYENEIVAIYKKKNTQQNLNVKDPVGVPSLYDTKMSSALNSG